MRLLKPSKGWRADRDEGTGCRLSRIVTYPPSSTGTNYNLIHKVEHDAGDRVVWRIINSPDGRFVYDYHLIRLSKQDIDRMCLDCHRVKVHGIKRLCIACANNRRRASNRKSQSSRRSRVRKTGFSVLRVEALTNAVPRVRSSGYDPANLIYK